MPNQKTYYRRHLPHYQPEGGIFHVSFRLAGSVAVSVLDKMRREREQYPGWTDGVKNESARLRFLRQYRRRYLERIEAMLDGGSRGPHWLNRPEIAAIVDEAIRYRDGFEYDLIAHTIMPNHVHLVVTNVGCPNSPAPVGRTDCPSNEPLSVGSLIRQPGGQGSVPSGVDSVGRTDCPSNEPLPVGSPTRQPGGRDRVPSGVDSVGRTDCPSNESLSVGSLTRQPGGQDRVPSGVNSVGRTDCPSNEPLSVGSLTRQPGGRDSVPSDKLLSDVLGSLKKYTALRANRVLGRSGAFWHGESYDHVIRDGAELFRTIWYVLNNPVSAGLCKHWREWKWTYVREEYIQD